MEYLEAGHFPQDAQHLTCPYTHDINVAGLVGLQVDGYPQDSGDFADIFVTFQELVTKDLPHN